MSDPNEVVAAAVQMRPKLGKVSENLAYCLKSLDEAADKGARLVVFPEMALSGYIFNSKDEAMPVAETIPGPCTDALSKRCAALGVYAAVGLLEKEKSKMFNAAVFVGPEGLKSKYRKAHLPACGADLFVNKGDIPYEVLETGVGKIGMQISYDVHHPEGVRCLALKGAEIIANLVNYPTGVEFMYRYVLPSRVVENRLHLVTANRVGTERGVRFIGHSMIIDADSRVLARAKKEEIIYAELDLSRAREKRDIIDDGKNANNVIEDRRPELYGEICKRKRAR